MATASELLASIEEVDKTLVVDNDLRVINIPPSIKTLGVEYDDEVLKLDFRLPRYVSDTDLSEFSITINYINSNGETDAYDVKDKAVYSDSITFSWLVGPTATRYRGNTGFNVCLKITDSEGVIEKEYNTTIATLPVLEGLEVDERIVTEYSDIIEQWKRDLFGIGDTLETDIRTASQEEQLAIANKGAEVIATIPPDYTTAVRMTDNADRTKSDAIIRTTQSEVIRVDDSSDDYLRGLKVFGRTTQVTTTGKNLVPWDFFINQVYVGVSFKTKPDGSVVATGTPSQTFSFPIYASPFAPEYFPPGNYIVTGGVDEQHYIHVMIFAEDGTRKSDVYSYENKIITVEENDMLSVAINFSNTNTVNNMTFYPMIRDASIVDDTYEPYSGGEPTPSPYYPQELVNVEKPTISIYGKNLLSIEHVELDGSSLDDVMFEGRLPLPLTFSWVQDFSRTTDSAMFSYVVDGETRFTTSASAPGLFTHVIDNGQYLEKVTLINWAPETGNLTNIQLELGTVATEYEPYKPVQPIELPSILPGIMLRSGNFYNRIDANGNKWICDEIDFERGVYLKRVNELICKGDEGWVKHSTYPAYSLLLNRQAATGLCTHMNRLSYTELQEGWQGVYLEQSNYAIVQMQDYFPSLSTFETYLVEQYNNGTPVTFQYAFEIPEEIPLTREELDWFRSAHTNYRNTVIVNDSGAAMELKYNADTKTYLDNCFRPTDDQVRDAVHAWLEAHYIRAEGVRF